MRQRGAVLLALVGLIALALSAAVLTGRLTTGQRDTRTSLALAQAREALIAFASTVAPDTAAKRPGDLPCPDLDNDGDAEATCIQPAQRLGRLPWKTLAIPDLRDGAGERLWYAVSVRFKRNNTNPCPLAGGANCLNSDTGGTLTLRDASGSLLNDGAGASAAIALVIAPGAVLARLGEDVQVRSCGGDPDFATCASTGRCSTPATPLCNPVNYLDRVGPPVMAVPGTLGGAEDNADIAENLTANGFIQGPIRDAAAKVVVNDRIGVIRYEDVLPTLERRVARTALRCLADYAAASGNRFPWAAAASANYALVLSDQPALTFGRLPNALTNTAAQAGMAAGWPASCPIPMSSPAQRWWANWQNLVFFAVAPAAAPDSPWPACGACLSIAPSLSADRHVVVLVAGRALAGQIRGIGAGTGAYLEATNPGGGPQFTAQAAAAFNDVVLHQ